jgi:hypothetical protein
MRTLLDNLEIEAKSKSKDKSTSLSEFEEKRASFYRDLCRAGQARPGETKGALRLSQGALARPKHRSQSLPEGPSPTRYTFGTIYGQGT